MKKLIAMLTLFTLLLGVFAVLPASAADSLDDHLITHWDFAGDNVYADKAPAGASSDTLSKGKGVPDTHVTFADGCVTLASGAQSYLLANDSADFMRTPQLTSAADADKYDRTVFIRFKVDYVDGKTFKYNSIMAQNGAFNMTFNNTISNPELKASTKYLKDENRVFGNKNSGDVNFDGSAWMTIAVTYEKMYDETNGADFEAKMYTKLENGSNAVRKAVNAASTDSGQKYTANPNLMADECPADCTGNSNHGTKLGNAFVIGGDWHQKHMGNNFTLIIDDIRIYDKVLTGDELVTVRNSITNPEPTPGVIPPTSGDQNTAQFTNEGHSLTLKGNTDINYFFKAVDGAQIGNEAVAVLTNASGKQVDIAALSDITKTDGVYKYSYGVSAKQMNEVFTLTVKDGDNTVYTNTYSVREYAKYIIDNASKYEAKLVALVKSMINYGAYAQIAFDYQADNLANKDLGLAAPADITVVDGLGAAVSGSITGITYSAATLVLSDATHVVFKFNVNGVAAADITVEGADSHTLIAGKTLQVKSEGLVADALSEKVSIRVTVGTESITVSYSPLAYIMNMADAQDANTQNLVKAMYAYHLAAVAYTA